MNKNLTDNTSPTPPPAGALEKFSYLTTSSILSLFLLITPEFSLVISLKNSLYCVEKLIDLTDCVLA